WKWTVCCSNRSGRMIMPTLVRVRKNSSSSSIAINGAGMLPFITPTSMMGRGSTCPLMGPPVPSPLLASTSGTSPTAPLYVTPLVAGSPGCSGVAPGYTALKTLGNCVPGRPLAMSVSPDNGPKENRYVCVPSPMRSEEHTSELQSRGHLVCRLLLEKKKKTFVVLIREGSEV